jgi:hypothetical protein
MDVLISLIVFISLYTYYMYMYSKYQNLVFCLFQDGEFLIVPKL